MGDMSYGGDNLFVEGKLVSKSHCEVSGGIFRLTIYVNDFEISTGLNG